LSGAPLFFAVRPQQQGRGLTMVSRMNYVRKRETLFKQAFSLTSILQMLRRTVGSSPFLTEPEHQLQRVAAGTLAAADSVGISAK
jgi:hypothetical protein